MKNLYQKLSKDNHQKMVDFLKEYPHLGTLVINTLESNVSWSQIPLGHAMQIWFVFEDSKPFDFNGFTELFKNN
jgi:hypothetical protein